MAYEIVSVDAQSVTLWDGTTRDADHPREPAGLLTLDIGTHTFRKGDKVLLKVHPIPITIDPEEEASDTQKEIPTNDKEQETQSNGDEREATFPNRPASYFHPGRDSGSAFHK